MNLLKRIGWYLGGFSVGLIILAIFLKKKNAEFCYGPECRVLKNIRSKNITYSESASNMLLSNRIDSIIISEILKNGDVNFSQSNTKLDSCKVYRIEDDFNEKQIHLTIENCSKTATITSVELK